MAQSRLDVRALYLTLNSERAERRLSWRQLAQEAGVGASTLSRMAQGNRPDVDSFVALVQWLGMPAERFMRGGATGDEATATTPGQAVASLLRADKHLDPDSVSAIDDILRAAMRLVDKGQGLEMSDLGESPCARCGHWHDVRLRFATLGYTTRLGAYAERRVSDSTVVVKACARSSCSCPEFEAP